MLAVLKRFINKLLPFVGQNHEEALENFLSSLVSQILELEAKVTHHTVTEKLDARSALS